MSTLPEPERLLKEAQQIYQIKGEILHKQEDLDRGGGWLWNGAQFLRHNTGADFCKETLRKILQDLEKEGANSTYFHSFHKAKRRDWETILFQPRR